MLIFAEISYFYVTDAGKLSNFALDSAPHHKNIVGPEPSHKKHSSRAEGPAGVCWDGDQRPTEGRDWFMRWSSQLLLLLLQWLQDRKWIRHLFRWLYGFPDLQKITAINILWKENFKNTHIGVHLKTAAINDSTKIQTAYVRKRSLKSNFRST